MAILQPKGNFLKAADVKTGDVIEFANAGEWKDSKFTKEDGSLRKQFVIGTELNGFAKDMALNSGNREALIAVFGNDTEKWIGRKAKIEKVKVSVAGKLMDSIMLNPMAQD
jgi:hypothetical protein